MTEPAEITSALIVGGVSGTDHPHCCSSRLESPISWSNGIRARRSIRGLRHSQRTMELWRHAGVQDVVEEAAALEFVQNGAIVAVESLCGKELQYFYKSWNEGVEDLSATPRLFITQVGLEPCARGRRRTVGAVHRTDHRTRFLQPRTRRAWTATLQAPRDGEQTDHPLPVPRRAADGAHSSIREQLGIGGTATAASRVHHDLLPRRHAQDDRRPQPQRHLRAEPQPVGILPLLHRWRLGIPLDLLGQRPGDRREARPYRRPQRRALQPSTFGSPSAAQRTPRSRSRTCSAGRRPRPPRGGTATAGYSWSATPLTPCRRPAVGAATPGSRMPTTSPGSWRWSWVVRPAPRCWTATTPSAVPPVS